METLPEKIRIKITEKDRLGAGHYQDGFNCLVAKSLKRRGYNHNTEILVGKNEVSIGRELYSGRGLSKKYLCAIKPSTHGYYSGLPGPYYKKSVVGKEVVLTKK